MDIDVELRKIRGEKWKQISLPTAASDKLKSLPMTTPLLIKLFFEIFEFLSIKGNSS